MAMNRAQFKKELQAGLNSIFGLEYVRHPERWRKYMDVETESQKAYVEDVLVAGFGAAATKAEGAGITYATTSEVYTARYIFETIALAFAITEEAEEDNLYGSIGARLSKALARSMQHTKAVKNANVINNGFDVTFPGGDAVALFSVSHPVRMGGVQVNTFATGADLSETSLEDMLILIGLCLDDQGIPIALSPTILGIPVALKFIAHRILYSDLRTDTAENDLNAIKDMGIMGGGYVADERFTDPDAWFIKTDCPDGLKHIVRKGVTKKIEGDFETGNMRYKSRERYIQGWSDWRGAWGSPGA